MTPAHRRYILVETLVSAGINAVLSIVFTLLVFGGERLVAVPALVRDALPQSFMITLMAWLVPSLLTGRRLRAGAIAPLPGRAPRGHVAVVSLLAAVVVAAVAGAVHWAVLPVLLPPAVPFGAVLAGKAVYGALLGAVVTRVALARALIQGT